MSFELKCPDCNEWVEYPAEGSFPLVEECSCSVWTVKTERMPLINQEEEE